MGVEGGWAWGLRVVDEGGEQWLRVVGGAAADQRFLLMGMTPSFIWPSLSAAPSTPWRGGREGGREGGSH